MSEFNIDEWREYKKLQESCAHEYYVVELTKTTNGNPLRRFKCEHCHIKEPSLQLATSDVDRIIASKKHNGKTLQEIYEIDAPYLYWVAVKSKMPQMDRFACARILAKKPYTVPEEGALIPRDDMYRVYVETAREFIIANGGNL